MGVKDLWKLLDGSARAVAIETLDGQILAVDVSIWLNQAIKGSRDQRSITSAHLILLFHRLCTLLFHNIKPVVVFDGATTDMKRRTLVQRRRLRHVAQTRLDTASAKLIRNYAMSVAVEHVTGVGMATSKPATAVAIQPDLFQLPVLPDSNNLLEVPSATEEDTSYLDYYEDVTKLDFDGEAFGCLPVEIQHELITERKKLVWNRSVIDSEALPHDAGEFSGSQLARLVQRNQLNKRLVSVRKSLSLAESSTMVREDSTNGVLEVGSIASHDAAQYILVKNDVSLLAPVVTTTEDNTSDRVDTTNGSLVKADDTVVKADDTVVKADNTLVKADDTVVKADYMAVVVTDDKAFVSGDRLVTTVAGVATLYRDELPVEDAAEAPTPSKQHVSDVAPAVEVMSDSDSGSDDVIPPAKRTCLDGDHMMHQPSAAELQRQLELERSLLQQEQAKHQRSSATVSNQMYEEVQELLCLFGVPYVVSPCEAEAQCAIMDYTGQTNGTISDDSDYFLFGGKQIYRNFFSNDKDIKLYNSETITRTLALDRLQLINLAYLLGSDYTLGVSGVGTVTAMQVLKDFPGCGLEVLKNFKLHQESGRSRLRHLNLNPSFPDERVQQAYLHPSVDECRDQLEWSLPDLDLLRQYAREKFGWDQKRTDQYLLPVIKRLHQRAQTTLQTQHLAINSRRLHTAVSLGCHGDRELSSSSSSDEE